MYFKRIKVYGERNCGTNYLEKIIALNFHGKLLSGTAPGLFVKYFGDESADYYFHFMQNINYGWKHSFPNRRYFYDDQTIFVFILKNPYSYLVSTWNRPYHMGCNTESFSKFIESEINSPDRENFSKPKFKNIFELINEKYIYYMDCVKEFDNCIFIKYEDLLLCPNKLFQTPLVHNAKSFKFLNYKKASKPSDNKNFEYYKKFYSSKEYLKSFRKKDIKKINKLVLKDVFNRAGFEMMKPSVIP